MRTYRAHIGVEPCGCVTAIMVNNLGTEAEGIAAFVRYVQKTGRRVEHVEFEEGKNPFLSRCAIHAAERSVSEQCALQI